MTDALAREPQTALCGFCNVLKPPGMTSAAVVGRMRRLLGGAKVGHAGTLDPEAAGVLPLMVGRATRLFDYLQDKQKAYVAEIAFGCATDTQDAQGAPVATGARYPSEGDILRALPAFTGEITQRMPMFSAIRVDGQRLYDLARHGRTVETPSRPATVYALELLQTMPEHGALLSVRCAKGFYVRTLCHDLGEALGCPAHMRFLLRTRSGAFTLDTAQTLEEWADAAARGTLQSALLAPDAPLTHLPRADIPLALRAAFLNGRPLPLGKLPGWPDADAPVRLYLNGALAAIAQKQGDEARVRTWLYDAHETEKN